MKRVLLFVLILGSVFAHARSPQVWMIRSVRCESGTLTAQNPFSPDMMTSKGGVGYVLNVWKGNGLALTEPNFKATEHDVVASIIVTGEAGSPCANAGQPTEFVLEIAR